MKNCGLLGYGYWGKILSKYIDESDLFDLKLIYSSKPSTPKGTNDINDFFNYGLEVVFIALPIELHYQYAKLFLEQGLHVFCEKPLSSEPDEVIDLYNIANEKGLSLYVDYIYTHSPSINFIRESLPTIGNILYLDFSIKQFGKFYKNQNAFEVIGCHLLSVYFYLFENFKTEDAKIIIQPEYYKETSLIQKVIIENNEYSAMFSANLLSASKERRIEIIGENGIIVFNPLKRNTVLIYKHNYEILKKIEIKSFDETNNISIAIYHFNQLISNKTGNNKKLVIEVSKILKKIKDEKG